MTYKPYNEKELLLFIAEGDEMAFAELFHYHRNSVYTVAVKMLQSPASAEEIVQDVFLKIWIRRSSLPSVQNFHAYLSVITRNDVFAALKRSSREAAGNVELSNLQVVEQTNTEEQLIIKEKHSLLQKAINHLPRQQQQVYRLIREEGMKREEVAHLLQIRPDTVKFHIAQAVKNLRAFYTQHLDTFVALLTCASLFFS